ncbi:MAG TPA: alpha/beta fold hydrolase [Actinomycetota bacterium]|nr:alpha/beta fold hydrolase [Actinomycetota bacterium]
MSAAEAKRRVRISAGELAVVDAGDPDAPPVLFLHGFPTSSFLWRAFVPMLPPVMRALAPDLLGAGDSDKPEDAPLGIEAQARYLGELLDALGLDRVAVVAHGHGGGTAQLLAIGGRVAVLVLIDSIAFDALSSEPMRELERLVARDHAHLDAFIGGVFDVGMGHRDHLAGEAVAEYRRPFAGEDGVRAFARWATSFEGSELVGLEKDLAALDIPAFLLWGEDDPFVPVEVAERLNELIPRSSLALLPGCKHFLPEDAPQTIAPLIYEYLRGTYAKQPHVHETGPATIELGRRYRSADASD